MSDVEKNIGTHKPEFDGKWVRLGDVCEINPRQPKQLSENETVSFLPLSLVNVDGTTELGEDNLRGDVAKGHPWFKNGDLLVAKITPSFENGKIARAKTARADGYASTEFHVVRPMPNVVDSAYVLAYLRSVKVRCHCAARMTGSAGQRRVPSKVLAALEMPFVPLKMQTAVGARFLLIDRQLRLYQKQLSALDDLVKSQFVEMFGELAPSVSLASICELFTDGDWIESKDQSIGGIRLLQTGNVGNGKFRNKGDKARYITGETFDRLQCKDVLAGDILISRLPDPVGRACAVPESLGRCITAVDCSILRLKPEWNVSFVVWFTRTADYENQIREYLTGTTRKRISRSNLGKIKIPAADSELQQQFADFVARVDKLGFDVQQQIEKLETLKQSLMQEYFG